jgi:hypothetical protein
MGLFNRKQKVGVEEFCRQFYDNVIFHPIIAGQDFNEVWYDNVFHSIVEADKSFAVIDKSVFRREMTALRLELFGLAWLYKFPDNRFTIPQSIFTRQYLESNGQLELWDSMVEYNKVIAQSAFPTPTGIQMRTQLGKQMQEGVERGKTTFVNSFRWRVFEKWADANIGDLSAPTEEEKILGSCVICVVSRMLADIRKNDCMLVKLLVVRLAERVGYDASLNAEAFLRLGTVIFSLYEGAEKAIKDIKLK